MAYNDRYLYIAAIAQDTLPYVSTTRKRDASLGQNDGVGFIIDPLNQSTNGFFFSVSPQNVQMEDVVSADNKDLILTWDNKWLSATKVYRAYWTAEIAVPLF